MNTIPRKGELWRENDPRYRRVVKILKVGKTHALVVGIVSGYKSKIRLAAFGSHSQKGYLKELP